MISLLRKSTLLIVGAFLCGCNNTESEGNSRNTEQTAYAPCVQPYYTEIDTSIKANPERWKPVLNSYQLNDDMVISKIADGVLFVNMKPIPEECIGMIESDYAALDQFHQSQAANLMKEDRIAEDRARAYQQELQAKLESGEISFQYKPEQSKLEDLQTARSRALNEADMVENTSN